MRSEGWYIEGTPCAVCRAPPVCPQCSDGTSLGLSGPCRLVCTGCLGTVPCCPFTPSSAVASVVLQPSRGFRGRVGARSRAPIHLQPSRGGVVRCEESTVFTASLPKVRPQESGEQVCGGQPLGVEGLLTSDGRTRPPPWGWFSMGLPGIGLQKCQAS